MVNRFGPHSRHFARFRGTDVHLVEFRVAYGGSLQMWKQYFGPKARIFGVDINPHCKKLELEQIAIFIGDQEDRSPQSEIPAGLEAFTFGHPQYDML